MTMRRLVAVQRFFKKPKGLLIIVMILLAAIAAPASGLKLVWPGLAGAVIASGLIDVVIIRLRHPRWEFPSGAVLTALIVAMILSPFEPWWVPAVTAAIAVVSKYVARTKAANIFNPAALALIVAFYAFHTGQNWWGALPQLPTWVMAVLIASGIFIADRVNRVPIVLVFLGVYYALFSVMAFAGDPRQVAEIFRAPDLHAALYFAFFMLTDPPTSPITYRDQIVCGVLVALVSFALFETTGVVYYLLAGLLAGNAWEAWRRVQFKRAHMRAHA